jgi:hypothetical protein
MGKPQKRSSFMSDGRFDADKALADMLVAIGYSVFYSHFAQCGLP